MKKNYDIIIIGGGPAGLAAAIAAYDAGVRDILVIERESRAGGILNQCIHNGFGLTRFNESLSGPEYAARFLTEAEKRGICILTNTTVIGLTEDKHVTAVSEDEGVFTADAKSVILAMGCRERSKGALNIAGSRPAGIYSAGTAQKYVNIMGYLPGRRVVILGSGDIGLIMARRMTLEGAKVLAVAEIMPYSSGLSRNIVQCLDDFDIPLYLRHTVTSIEGNERVSGVVISEVDDERRPIPGTEKHFDCDTVLFSVGLIPENELTKAACVPLSPKTRGAIVYENRETEKSGIFACGNVLQVHDLVDFVSDEAELAGAAAAKYVTQGACIHNAVSCNSGENVSYVLPQRLDKGEGPDVTLFFRVTKSLRNCTVSVRVGDKVIMSRKKRIVLPGEMERITISAEKRLEIDNDLILEVTE